MYKHILVFLCGTFIFAGGAAAQVVPDQIDPALVTRSLPSIAHDDMRAQPPRPASTTPPSPARITLAATGIVANRIVVADVLATSATDYSAATAAYLHRPLTQGDLSQLAGAVASIARARGLVFASASIAPQSLADNILRVTLDEGRIDAVRSIGRSNASADRILSRLITHRAVTKAELERTILLVGDLPGVRIASTQYLRQDGFGILLVTLTSDRVMLYGQIDNRGTSEIGRLRATGLADLRNNFVAGDEIGLVAATTPAHPEQFAFLSGHYAAPVGQTGGVASITGYYGRTHAGGDLATLDLIGHSYGGAIDYSLPLRRSRRSSLWFDLELRTLVSNQSVLGRRFRDDDITVLTATLKSAGTIVGGGYHANLAVSWGLPLPGMTHAGDAFASRPDGDARFVTSSLVVDWAHRISGPFSVALASVAQVASRPLLATAEISLGGPAFGRAYDYSERTGDDGVLGSAELRADLTHLRLPLPSRAQLYLFADGGVVTNLRNGYGGGRLASAGAGIRIGHSVFDGGLEVAFPLNEDRFDTRNRAPRLSFQLSAHV